MLLNCGGERTLESPFSRDCKEIKPPKENQLWIIIGKTDAEVPVLWPPNAKSQLIGKYSVAGKDWGQEEKGQQRMREHHWLNGYESEQTIGDSEG